MQNVPSAAAKAGLPPESLVFIGEKVQRPPQIFVTTYTPESISAKEAASPEEAFAEITPSSAVWINVEGLSDVGIITAIGKQFGIHSLILEDVLHTNQRPRVEIHESYVYVVLKMANPRPDGKAVRTEQVSIIFGKNYLVTFQEGHEGDVFGNVRDCLAKGRGRCRKSGADYLAYSIIDSIVDSYFVALERYGERFSKLENSVISNPDSGVLERIYRLKREVIAFRRAVWPVRELISTLERDGEGLIDPQTRPYFRDLYGHGVEVLEMTEMYRDMAASLMDIYLSSVSNRLNTIMKVLAVVSTIFMPLTFLAGIYGMNFKNMPELEWRYGYPGLLLIMVVLAAGMLLYFKKKRWI